MKRFAPIPLIAAMMIFGAIGLANASSHSIVARAETKLLLQSAVDEFCTEKPGYDCQRLKTLATDLYKDPKVVTNDDLKRIDRLKAIFAKYNTAAVQVRLASARTDLASAINRAEMLTNHVFFIHKGVWEEYANCTMDTPT